MNSLTLSCAKHRPWPSAGLREVVFSTCFIVLTLLSLTSKCEMGLETTWNALLFNSFFHFRVPGCVEVFPL